jgi:uncharacterized metal-binding protein
MAMGRSHDRATSLLALPYGLLWWPPLGLVGVAVAAGAFLVGGLWLSPDLDTRSNTTRRWGPLRLLWWPYRHWIPHRSILSHSPLLGSAGRLLYFGVVLFLASLLLMPFGSPGPDTLANALLRLWSQQRPLLMAAVVGIELSSWLHLLQDGDPLPKLRFKQLQLVGTTRRPRRSQRPRRPHGRSRGGSDRAPRTRLQRKRRS